MSDPSIHEAERAIADRLAAHELNGAAFDPRVIAHDYGDRLQMDASLDPLIGEIDTDVMSNPGPAEPS